MIKYKALLGRIEKVEIKRETEQQVVLKNGRKEGKKTNWCNYCDTWNEAYNFLVINAEKDIEGATLSLDRAKAKLVEIKKLVSF